MARSTAAKLHRGIRTLYSVGTIRDLGDGQLLERFATAQGESAELAFAVLVERHGPMVLRVCQSVLADWHETEDAFQATFLVLVKKARRLWVQDSLGPWLHQVAVRTASAARVAASRRRRCEEAAAAHGILDHTDPGADLESFRLLHEEINCLPERFRLPLVLCDLEERSHQQAARHLGWPIGTVKSRLARGREHLRNSLVRRGVSPDAGICLCTASSRNLSLSLRLPALIDTTARAALVAAATSAVSSGSTAALAKAAVRALISGRWLKAAAIVAGVSGVAVGAGFQLARQYSQSAAAQEPAGPNRAAVAPNPEQSAPDFPKGTIERIEFRGTVVPRENIASKLLSQVGQPLDREQFEADLKTLLGTRWFLDAVYLLDEATRGSGKYTVTFKLTDRLTIATVKADNIHAVVSEPGIVTRANIQSAINNVEGESVIRWILPDGTAVKKGDVVCTLEPNALKEKLDHQHRVIESARAAHDASMEATAVAEIALDEYKRSGAALKSAALKSYVLKALEDHVKDQQATVQAKRAALYAEQKTAATLTAQLKNCDIVAPTDGIIVHANDLRFNNRRPNIANGASVRERQIIFKIPDINTPLRVQTHLPQWSITRLKRGSVVKIRAGGGRAPVLVLTGKIDEIARLPDTQSYLYHGPSLYTTRIRIDEPPPDLVMDMNVRVEIDLGEFGNVLTVPADSVVFSRQKDLLAVKNASGAFEWRSVALGVTDGASTEVTQGVQSGEVVLREPARLLSNSETGIPNSPASPVRPR